MVAEEQDMLEVGPEVLVLEMVVEDLLEEGLADQLRATHMVYQEMVGGMREVVADKEVLAEVLQFPARPTVPLEVVSKVAKVKVLEEE